MKNTEIFKEENDLIKERYDLSMERVEAILEENNLQEPYHDYFQKVACFITQIKRLIPIILDGSIEKMSAKELHSLNYSLYEDILEENYETSYANPQFAVNKLGNVYGKILCFLYTEIRGMIVYAFEARLVDITIFTELFIEVYNYLEEEDDYTQKDVKRAIYDFMSDYSADFVDYRTRELLDPNLTFVKDIIMNWDLEDLRYLYHFGEYISENEIQIAKFLNHLSEEEVKAMAFTYVEGYRKGFVEAGIDLSKKSTVNIRYNIGFERMVRYAIEYFAELGLEPIIYRAAVSSINRKQHLRIGYHSTGANRQYDYDHRLDSGIYLDKAFIERKLEGLRNAYEKYKELGKKFAGPAVIEVFGEKIFTPVIKEEAIDLDNRQQKLSVNYDREANVITNEYVKRDEWSFTIISYPIPEIGEQFNEIFAETVKVNNLDSNIYQDIQQIIIDALDQGEYVHVLGMGKNQTDIKVILHKLQDPSKETLFENCTADVNIPVGEVFTSPKLTGTEGILHVTKVFLNGLEYNDLHLNFKDGMIAEHTCKNFSSEDENVKFVKQNLMYNQETLPLGEFAIGTNTAAYVMGRKFNISDKLPILIAEKTGPHFAVGDTCYQNYEDTILHNPNGKEIIAKDNEISILRKTDVQKAYFGYHTDITIPYDELGEISVYKKNGEKIMIIKEGRFVLPGTELLNVPFDETVL